MIRGTTAQFKFKLPYKKEELIWLTIKFWQPNNPNKYLPVTKRLANCEMPDGSTELYVSLLPTETMLFSEKYKARVQLRANALDGTVFGSRVELFTVYPANDEILDEDPAIPAQNKAGFVTLDGDSVSGGSVVG